MHLSLIKGTCTILHNKVQICSLWVGVHVAGLARGGGRAPSNGCCFFLPFFSKPRLWPVYGLSPSPGSLWVLRRTIKVVSVCVPLFFLQKLLMELLPGAPFVEFRPAL